jgi:hypothetical protein
LAICCRPPGPRAGFRISSCAGWGFNSVVLTAAVRLAYTLAFSGLEVWRLMFE